MFAQVLQRDVARGFWEGKLMTTSLASVIVALVDVFSDHYKVYSDVVMVFFMW